MEIHPISEVARRKLGIVFDYQAICKNRTNDQKSIVIE